MDEARPKPRQLVPRLDDLIVRALAEQYAVYPALDRIPPEYVDSVVALLDPSQIPFTTAAKHISTEKFWERMCRERWSLCDHKNYGLCWKRQYCERHIQGLIEGYFSDAGDEGLQALMEGIKAGAPFVTALQIQQFLSHVDINLILGSLTNLNELSLTCGARNLGMDFDTNLFGMKPNDVNSLALFMANPTCNLTSLTLQQNLIDDQKLQVS